MSKSDFVARQCRDVAKWLREQGEAKRANDVENLIRINTNMRTTMSQLWADNAALRSQIEGNEE